MRPHGRIRYKCDGCRCDLCRAAMREEFAERYRAKAMGTFRPTMIDAAGTRRRIQALMALGYACSVIGERLNTDRRNVLRLTHRRQVTQDTADQVAAVYNDLWGRPAPNTAHAARLRNTAKAKGWPLPMAWDDDSIDDPLAEPHQGTPVDIDWLQVARAVAGKPRGRRLTKQERRAAAEVMALKGESASAISKTLGLSGSDAQTVIREVAA